MRNQKKIAYVGEADEAVSESLHEYGYRLESVPGSFAGLLRSLYKMRPAALHARQNHLKAAVITRLLGIPLVLEAQGAHAHAKTARAARMAERTICAGAAVRESLLQLGAPPSSTVVMRSLVECSDSAAALHPPMLDQNSRWIVAAAPCDSADRGHHDLLLAFFSAARTRPNLKLLIAGDGPEARKLREQAASAGMLKRVVVHAVHASQLPSIFAHAAVVVAPSRSSGSPDAVPEALAVGAPVVATGVGSHPVWIREGRTGWLVPPRSPAALGARLSLVLDDVAGARRVGDAARRAAIEASSPKALAQELSRCYAVVTSNPHTSPRISMRLPGRTLSRA
jgi:glycosyltransferase involved in cell wall biosynthesis